MSARLLAATSLAVALLTIGIFSSSVHANAGPGYAMHTATTGSGPMMGPEAMLGHAAFQGYYDSHKVTYFSTDTSDKAQAKAWGINYSSALGAIHGSPAIYLLSGRAAAHQLAVFGSQPGEVDYSPLWQETTVQWKAGAKVVLLTSDNQVKALVKKGTLKLTSTPIVLNCPIVKVSK